MRGSIPPLPQYVFMAWCLVKHRDNFTFIYSLCLALISLTRAVLFKYGIRLDVLIINLIETSSVFSGIKHNGQTDGHDLPYMRSL
jgi:hypothetical protein